MKYTLIKSFCTVVFLSALSGALLAAESNTVYEELVNQGVPLANGKTIKLPTPVMADGLKAAAQQDVLTQVGPKIKNLMQQFVRGKPNDWYEDKQSSEAGAGPNNSIGRRIDLYFVAQGKLETVASQGFIDNQINQTKKAQTNPTNNAGKSKDAGEQEEDAKKADKKNPKPENGKVEFYTPDELKARKLTEKDSDTLKERYAQGTVNLLDKVQVSGSGYAVETRTPESLLIAFKMDHRFDKDPKYPNQYQLIKAVGPPPVLGPPKPYTGFAGYAKITKLQGTEDKIFVEYHLIYDEPFEWFNGTTELVSKLDTSYKENIAKFRRDILEFQQAQPANGVPAAEKANGTPTTGKAPGKS